MKRKPKPKPPPPKGRRCPQARRATASLTLKQWDEVRFALEVNSEIYGQNPGRAKQEQYCIDIWRSIRRQIGANGDCRGH